MSKAIHALVFVVAVVAGIGGMWTLDPKTPKADVQKTQDETGTDGPAAERKVNPGAVKVEFFVMSQCPYGVQVVDAVKPVIEELGADVDFHLEFVGDIGPGGNLSSMHGPAEVTGDIAQLCAAQHAPDDYLKMVACQNKDMRSVATNWEQCARAARLPVSRIRKCLQGSEGQNLLRASFERAKARGATGSPTIFIAGQPYQGRRQGKDFLRAICAAHGTPPPACEKLPPVVEVNVTVLSDSRCADCDSQRALGMVRQVILKPVVRELDYEKAEGKALYDQIGGGKLPLVVFDETIDADVEATQAFSQQLRKVGKQRVLDLGGAWNPKCADPKGCEIEECKETLSCREEKKNSLEVFVMSQCPYGVKALNAMEEVLEAFGGELLFAVHFIAEGTAAAGFKALHGQPEVDENIRELCAIEHYRKGYEFMKYILCRNKDIRSDKWELCTGDNGIDTEKIRTCFESDKGKELHEQDIRLGNSLGIGASPTWVVNGRHKFSGVDAETVRKNVCQHNPDLAGCSKTLSGPDRSTPAGSDPGCGK